MAEPQTEALGSFPPTIGAEERADTSRVTERPTSLNASPGPRAVAESPAGARFSIIREHAQGGLGKVSVAFDGDVKRLVAFKEIRPDRDGPDARLRFLNEAEITGQLEHPGIVPIYAAGRDAAGHPFYAMRFIEGTTFAQAIQRFHGERPHFESLQFRELLQRFNDVCQTLAFAHSKGVIHRDVKPANVLLGDYGETLLVDWGLAKRMTPNPADTETPLHQSVNSAKVFDAASPASVPLPSSDGSDLSVVSGATMHTTDLTQAGQILGTPAYMSPEQAAGEFANLGPATDVYALGVILYEILAGQLPYAGTFQEVCAARTAGPLPCPTQVQPAAPRPLEAVALKAMHPEPDARYATASGLAKDVEKWLADEPVTAWNEPWSVRVRRWGRQHKTLATSLLLTLLLLTVGIVAGTYQWRSSRWQQDRLREENLNTLRQTALSQEQLGLAALQSNRWTAAAQLFHEALATLGDAEEHEDLRQRIAGRAQRTQQFINYRRHEQRMAEAIVFDDEQEALEAVTKALAQFDTLTNPRWWEALPDDDLTPRQRELLRLDVHGHLLLLASIRARHGLMNVNNPDKAREGCRQALEVLAAAQAFVPTVTADTVAVFCRVRLGEANPQDRVLLNRAPVVFADHLFLGMVHVWLADFSEDPITRFFLQTVKSPLIDLNTPLATAERRFRTSIAMHPDYAWTYALFVDALLKAGKPGEAELAARTHVALNPDEPMAQRLLAVALMRQAQRATTAAQRTELQERALAAAERIVELGGERWQTFLMRGVLRLEADRFQDALVDLQRARDLSAQAAQVRPRHYEIHKLIGHVHANLGRHGEAVEAYTKAIMAYPEGMNLYGPANHARLYEGRADAFLAMNDFHAAMADYDEAVRLSPDADSYDARAVAWLKNNQFDQAIADAGQVIRLAPKGSSGYLRRAEAHLRQGKLAAVLPDCDKALSLNARATLANEFRGRIHALRGDWTAAATEFRAIIKDNPRSSAGRYWLALALLAQADQEAHRHLCSETLTLLEQTADRAVAGDVVLLCGFGEGADARRVLELAERMLQPSKAPRDRVALGVAYFRAGRLDEAQKCFQEGYPALPQGKPWVLAAVFRGLCALQQNQPSEARPWLAAARQWHRQFTTQAASGDFAQVPHFDSLNDWQARILIEALTKETDGMD